MAVVRIQISLHDDELEAIDHAAGEMHESRSRFMVAGALRRVSFEGFEGLLGKPTEGEESCQSCRFWHRASDEEGAKADEKGYGHCRIRAPVNFFPWVKEGDWCGEHES